jgi:hypothetical protein
MVFTIPDEKDERRRNAFLRDEPCSSDALEKGKGRDIGYALAISSCEGANSVDLDDCDFLCC